MSKAKILWFTGLSGSGKTTIATGLEKYLTSREEGKKVLVLDGDKIRATLNKNLGFSRQDILLNNSSIVQLCQENIDLWDYILVVIISPFSQSREEARKVLGENFHEVYIKASLDKLISRDTKGFYHRALNGKMKDFIGIDKNVPYEPPEQPDIIIDTENQTPLESIEALTAFITQKI